MLLSFPLLPQPLIVTSTILLCTDSEEMVHMLTVWIWECGKVGSHFGTLDPDGPAHLEPLTEG